MSNDKIDYVAAREVKLGDRFYVHSNGQLEYSTVVNITIELKTGYFAPLTMTGRLCFSQSIVNKIFLLNKGTLLVNDVFASCFATAKNHQLAQMFMAPFRWYYQITRSMSMTDPFGNDRTDGIHWLIKIIYQFISYVQPSTLQLS